MKPEFILLTGVGGFFCALIIFLVIFYKPNIATKYIQTVSSAKQGAATTETDAINSLKSKVKFLEEQVSLLQNLKLPVATSSAEDKIINPTGKSILATASTQGSIFTTTSPGYTPMGMYVNISCPKNCLLWINFYSSSKNLGPISSEQGNLNTYGIFLDGVDKSIFSQASFVLANLSVPVSLNAFVPVSSGVHTIEVKTKTTGGTLQSDSSGLQVLAIEK